MNDEAELMDVEAILDGGTVEPADAEYYEVLRGEEGSGNSGSAT